MPAPAEHRSKRPPSVDAIARSLTGSGLPHPLLVDLARAAIADGTWPSVTARAAALRRTLLQPVINATGVLLHTNLGRAVLAGSELPPGPERSTNLELDLNTGQRGSRQSHVGTLLARLCGAEQAVVVNNNAAAVLLATTALAAGGEVIVARGESVEIGGGFRLPEVVAQSNAVLRDVGTTNRTRLDDYRRAIGPSTAMILKIHPSNYRVEGFVEETSVAELATLPVPVVADIGSGLVDATCPWLSGGPPPWLTGEPAARQTLEAGAALVTFSGDKLLGGPQAGIVAGRADLVARCARHPLARALRPGGLVLDALQTTVLAYLRRDVTTSVPFWRIVTTPVEQLRERADAIVAAAGLGAVGEMDALPGAGSLPGVTLPSAGVVVPGDHLAMLRAAEPPIIARVRDQRTFLDLRAVDPLDDALLVTALRTLG
ncbi:MAG: L-seryl-tRNA(Sec) selenium transferase [Acidimicrobiia bacterium]